MASRDFRLQVERLEDRVAQSGLGPGALALIGSSPATTVGGTAAGAHNLIAANAAGARPDGYVFAVTEAPFASYSKIAIDYL